LTTRAIFCQICLKNSKSNVKLSNIGRHLHANTSLANVIFQILSTLQV